MEIEKIYNNADSHEILAYVLYAKVDSSNSALYEDASSLYVDEKCTKVATINDVEGININLLMIVAKDTTDLNKKIRTYKPVTISYGDNNMFVEVIEDKSDLSIGNFSFTIGKGE